MDLELITSILTIAVAAGTSLIYGTIGEIYTERSGILNLGVEGMMIMGAVIGFAAAYHTGNAWAGVGAALLIGGRPGKFSGREAGSRWRPAGWLAGSAFLTHFNPSLE